MVQPYYKINNKLSYDRDSARCG